MTIAVGSNQPGITHNHQVLRDRGLALAEIGFKVADTRCAGADYQQDLNPGRLGDQAQKLCSFLCGM